MLELINLLQKVLALSKAKRAPTTGSSSTKTAKGKLRLDPILANASMHWLALWYVCSIRLLGISFKRFLQSDKRGFINIFTVTLFISWTTLKASISTIRLLRHRSLARVSPSLRTHNSAMKLLVEQRLLEKPIIQSPLWSWISPPPPATPGFPRTEPSVLSLAHPSGRLHATGIMDLDVGSLVLVPTAKNSAALWMHFSALCLLINSFLFFFLSKKKKKKRLKQNNVR